MSTSWWTWWALRVGNPAASVVSRRTSRQRGQYAVKQGVRSFSASRTASRMPPGKTSALA